MIFIPMTFGSCHPSPSISIAKTDRIGRSRLVFCSALVFALALLWSGLRYPGPLEFIADPDGGYQLAGATAILGGDHPYSDFREIYGPLTFYTSALGQFLSGKRVIGELALICFGYALAYTLLFLLVHRCSENRVFLALGFSVFGLLLIPRAYKYYIVLFPLLALVTMWRYVQLPSRSRIWQMGFGVTICGLFRPDFGIYCFLAGVAAVVFVHRSSPGAWIRRVAGFAAIVFAVASPWLLWIASRGALGTYLVSSSIGSLDTAVELALPLPSFSSMNGILTIPNVRAVVFRLFLGVPTLAALVLALKWKRLSQTDRGCLLVTVIMGHLTLLQSMHRSEWGHLLQAIPVSIVLLAWLASQASKGIRKSGTYVHQVTSILSGLTLVMFLVACLYANDTVATVRQSSFSSLAQKISVFSGTREDLLRFGKQADPQNWIVETVEHIRTHTTPDERIVALPAFPQIYYLSDRLPGGGQLAVLPGYFAGPADQRRFIEELKTQDVGEVIVDAGFTLDSREDRTVGRFASDVIDYINKTFHPVQRAGPVIIYQRVPANSSAAQK